MMSMPAGNFNVLDPAGDMSFSVFTINYDAIQVQAYAVTADDWSAYQDWYREYNRSTDPPTPPGKRVMNKTIRLARDPDRMVETVVGLEALFSNRQGHLILIVQPGQSFWQSLSRRGRPPSIRTWLQASDIALDAFADSDNMLVWATRMSTGEPLAGITVSLHPQAASATTGSDGMADMAVSGGPEDSHAYLVGRFGTDVAVLPQSTYGWSHNWHYASSRSQYLWYVFDDRGMYRPGEEVHLKGWIRRSTASTAGDTLDTVSASALLVELYDARGNRLSQDTLRLNALGGFDTVLELPEAMNLGPAQVRMQIVAPQAGDGQAYAHTFQVQEFRRPEFEVATQASAAPHFVGESATVSVEATYYAGGPLANAEAMWQVTSSPGSYRPPKWDDYVFGIWRPWWEILGSSSPYSPSASQSESYEGTTDASGVHRLDIDFRSVEPPQPTSVVAEASVIDANRQAWTASSVLLVHPAEWYVGLRSERAFVERGEPIEIDAVVTDLDGQVVPGVDVQVRAVRLRWVYVKGEWQEQEADQQAYDLVSGSDPVSCSFDTPEGGRYRITATISDEQGRANLTRIDRWVSGGKQPTANRVEQEEVVLIPDGQEYQPGDTAEILVQSPFTPAEGLLTIRRAGIVTTERFRMDEPTYTLRVPISEAYIPNIHIQVDLAGAAPRLNSQGDPDTTLPQRPAYATGQLGLSVPALARTLSVTVMPRENELEPGGETTLDVQVRDAQGKPVAGAELAVVVVDESVLALTGYQLADPLGTFYPNRAEDVTDYYLRGYVLLVDPSTLEAAQAEQDVMATAAPGGLLRGLAMPQAAPMADGFAMAEDAVEKSAGAGAAEQPAIRMRTDMNALAVFEPEVPTDADGTASVAIKVPDNLTRYRVMVVAVAGDAEFGKGESSITARLALMVRPSPPRFLNFGDKVELPVVLQNQTSEGMSVDIALRTTNLELTDGAALRVQVPARDRVEVRFPATTVSAGTARVQVGAAAGTYADAAQFELPVYTPATTEAFAVYGTIDEGAIVQPIVAPSDVYTQFGGLEISTSSTALQALTDAVLYLVAYPYECSEQLASRVLAVAALRDVLSAFEAEGMPDPETLVSSVKRDIERLQAMQNNDGGFPVWVRGYDSWPYHSIHVAHALARARDKDLSVPDETISRSLSYLREIESHYPSTYSQRTRDTLTSYALYVRALLGDVDTVRARRLVDERGMEELGFEALGWLLNVMADDAGSSEQVAQIQRFLGNRVTETAGAAHFSTSYREEEGYLLLASNRRADGIILEAMIQAEPDSDLIPKIVRGLLAHRKAGRWTNTQENVFILLALDSYFQTYEAQTPDFIARAWLGDQYVTEFAFEGRTTEYQTTVVPMSYLAQADGAQDLILNKEGDGRLYYRLGLSYAPTDLDLAPLEQGFAVERSYEAIDDPADVIQDVRGVWHIKAGARVRVRLRLVAPTRRYHVALQDPLPAGLEPLNPALAVTGSIPKDTSDTSSSRYWWWRWTWYEHQNLRDQRAEAFASLLWDGIHTYTYVTRATTPGEFVVPPAKAEEMYSPEVFGRTGTDRVIVEP